MDDLRFLTHYDLVEATHGSVAVQEFWDAALSTGHPVWIIGGQDSHHRMTALWDSRPMSWTMVRSASTRRDDVLSALRAGRTYAVIGPHAENDVLLRSVEVRRDSLIVTTDSGAVRFAFIGQGGAVRAIVRDPRRAVYVLQPQDTYVRTVVETPHTTLFLNPVLRYDGARLQQPNASLDLRGTWLGRTGLLAVCIGLFGEVRRRRRGGTR
jgi:hypothetical protein